MVQHYHQEKKKKNLLKEFCSVSRCQSSFFRMKQNFEFQLHLGKELLSFQIFGLLCLSRKIMFTCNWFSCKNDFLNAEKGISTKRYMNTPCKIPYITLVYVFTSCMHAQLLSHVRLFATLWTAAHQAPLSMGFSRQEYWSGLQFSPPGYPPNSEIEPTPLASPVLTDKFFTTEPLGKPLYFLTTY